MNRLLATIVTIGCLAAIGVASGKINDRWGIPAELLAAAEGLKKVPMEIDGWTATEAPIDDRQLEVAGAMGSLSRIYYSPDKGHAVIVTILCGRHGPISLHEPTVCFVGAGMKQLRPESQVEVEHGATDSSFLNTEFSSPKPGEPVQRTFWSWSADTRKWNAPKNPRLEFVNAKVLYKVYFITPLGTSGGETKTETPPEVEQFMASFLKQLPEYLQASPRATVASALK